MKRYLLFILLLLSSAYMTAQASHTAILAVNEVNDEFYYDDEDCNDEDEEPQYFNEMDEVREETLRIYPNPTMEYIAVTENSSVAYLYVYNIIGRRVKAFPVFNGVRYSLRDLPDGMYLVSMVDAEGKVLKTVRTSKSMPRP